MAISRKKLIAGVMLAGLAGGMAATGAARLALAGPGDPPVIVLPSARKSAPVIQAQATQPVPPKLEVLPLPSPTPAPKLEVLPLPSPTPAKPVSNAKPPAVPDLLVPTQPLQLPPSATTLTPKEPPAAIAAKESAPKPKEIPGPVQPLEVLPPPTAKAVDPPGESIMTIRPSLAAGVASIFIAGGVRAEEPKPQTPIVPVDVAKAEDIKALKAEIEALRKSIAAPPVDYSKAADVKALKDELELLKKELAALPAKGADAAKAADLKLVKDDLDSLKKEIAGLTAKAADASKATDVKALKDEIDLLRKDLGAKGTDALKAADLKSLKDEVAALRKDLEAAPKPEGNKAVKDDIESIRKEVAALQTYLKQSLEGHRDDRGFTHDGLLARVKKLDESIAAIEKKVDGGTKSVSAKPEKPAEPANLGPIGTVRIVNEYPVEITIAVNGIAYRLDAGARRDVSVSPGNFKYQLLSSGGNETDRTIKENETVTLTIR